MGERRELLDEGALTSEESLVDVGAQIEALKARIEQAKRTTTAPGRETAPQTPQLPTETARPTADRVRIGAGRFRRNVIVAVVLILLAVGAALIFTGEDELNGGTRNPRASTNTTVAIDRASPGVTDPAAVTSPLPPASAPAIQEIRPRPTPESLSAPPGPAASVPTTTVVVADGESFWSIAERVVEDRGGGSTAEVASYWLELIEVNRDRLVQAGNPDLIYVGQEFSLP